jgi:hypothetical protein
VLAPLRALGGRARRDPRSLKTREGRARRDRTPVVVRRRNSPLEVALTHARPHQHRGAIARPVPFQRDATEVWLPGWIDARAILEHGESVLNVLRVWAQLGMGGVIARGRHNVPVPVGRLQEFLPWRSKEDVPQHHAADGRVRLERLAAAVVAATTHVQSAELTVMLGWRSARPFDEELHERVSLSRRLLSETPRDPCPEPGP